ncbi:MAG: penicillin-binding transpeptidase domain-containing protein [Bacteroidota bacterium]
MFKQRVITLYILTALVGATFLFRLFVIQVVDDTYKTEADTRSIASIVEYPYRGLIYDRNDNLLVYNEPAYDLMVIKNQARNIDTLALCEILDIPIEEYVEKMRKAHPIKPSLFFEMLSNEEFAVIQDQLIHFPGFFVAPRTVRKYPHQSLSHALGYLAEISKRQLEKDTARYYSQGDYVGINGIESEYEENLRGKRGIRHKKVNNRGLITGDFGEGALDSLSVPGDNITLTIDLELQQYAEKLMAGKVGSLVAIEPSTGEILAIVSSPAYDPNLLSGRTFSSNFRKIQLDSLKPLFNRPLRARYAPGSMFKTIQSLIALEEGVITANEQIYSNNQLIGDLAPIGYYDVEKAIQYSSNNYFFKVFRRLINQNQDPNTFIDSRLGLKRWEEKVKKFGLGVALDIDISGAYQGLVPDVKLYDRVYGENRWKFSNIASLSIGQGELTVTPLQMANLGALLANRGYYYSPHIIKSVGQEREIPEKYLRKNFVEVDSIHFEPVLEGMAMVVKSGSGTRAYMPDIAVCGKTSTVQNSFGEDHSGFMGFAPKDSPQIAIAAYVENASWGGRAAASTASLVMEKYIRGHITRKWLEDYVLKGEFVY